MRTSTPHPTRHIHEHLTKLRPIDSFYLLQGAMIGFTQRVYRVNEDEKAVVEFGLTSGQVTEPVTVR